MLAARPQALQSLQVRRRAVAFVLGKAVPRGDAVELSAEPGSAGFAWVLTQRAWVPWTGTESLPGVDVIVRLRRS